MIYINSKGAMGTLTNMNYPMSKKLEDFLSGNASELDHETSDELDRYEKHCKHIVEMNRARQSKNPGSAGGSGSSGAAVSITPKKNPHVGRIKMASRYKLSPYGNELEVSEEAEHVYKKLMFHGQLPNSSVKK